MENYNFEPFETNTNETDFSKEDAYLRAKKKVDAIIGFYWHLASYVIVNVFLILLIGLNSPEGFSGFGPYATAVFWGVGLAFHFLGVFGTDVLFGRHWETRKIEEFMEKERRDF